MRTILLVAAVCAAAPALAKDAVYRWVDANGVIHYGEKPQGQGAKPADLPELQIYQPGAGRTAAAVPEKPAVAALTVRITAPTADEIFTDIDGLVTVNAVAEPALPKGAGYVYYLNGTAKNKKNWASPTYVLTGVPAGLHSVAVAVVDASGRELQRSEAVSFQTQPPPP